MNRRTCPKGDGPQEVVDEFHTGEQTAGGETYRMVRELACGHYVEGPESIIAEAPGAPYAGPQVVVAASSRPRDLRAASDGGRVWESTW